MRPPEQVRGRDQTDHLDRLGEEREPVDRFGWGCRSGSPVVAASP